MSSNSPQPPNWGEFYGQLYSRRVDLVGDYAGSEPFLVEGDSLLLHCFSDELLDFEDGFQMLHAVWLVEDFLQNLHRRNCNFHLAFFDDREHLCIPSHANETQSAKYRLARAVVIRHLQANLTRGSSPMKLLVFPSLTSESFNTVLTTGSYMFVLMNDGAADACQCIPHMDANFDLRLAICSLITRGYSVALINGLEWRDTKAITAVIEGMSKSHRTKHPALNQSPPAGEEINFDKLVFGHELYTVFVEHHELAEPKLSERLYLVIATAANLVSDGDLPSSAVASFVMHTVLQSQLSLECRSFESTQSSEASQNFLLQFSKTALAIMKSPLWQAFLSEAQFACDISDLVDGRLFNMVLTRQLPLPELKGDFARIVSSLVTLDIIVPETQHSHVGNDTTDPAGNFATLRKLLPFAAEGFDKHLQPVKLDIDDNALQRPSDNTSKAFRELTHWHNAKRPLNRKAMIAAKDRAALYARRRDQRFMAEMMAYAASLTNAVGKALEPETIVTQDGQSTASHTAKDQQQSSQTTRIGGGKNKQKQARMDKLAAEQEKKEAAQNLKVFNSWHVVCKDIQREQQTTMRYIKALQFLGSLPTTKQAVVGSEIEFYALHCLLELWKVSTSISPKAPNLPLAAKIWDATRRLSTGSSVTKTMEERLRRIVDSLGLPFIISAAQAPDRKLPFEFALSGRNPSLKIPLPSKEFQLLHCGPYFDRKMDSAHDDRVPFLPDGWQREVLDAIDADKSLFVVAPTSAGKTFISFYAMKKILEGSNDGVIVYVAPTKALVNQIAAEIQARFSKTYKHAGKSVWAIHTRDYRVNNPTGCQVLVTVPHILQIMLLAPVNASSWSSRVKRIIFDEVHCIGQADDGIVWEQLLLLSPCPIIALSATVGNPEAFRSWLASAQKAAGNDLAMVHHPHRYSDLRKYVFTPHDDLTFEGLPKAPAIPRVDLDKGAEHFRFVHPVASLLNRSRGMPEDFSLEARDCFTLWKAMKAHESETHKVPDALDPKHALPDVIAQADIISWCKSLKQLLEQWMTERDAPYDAVIQDLGRSLYELEAESDMGLDNAGLCKTALSLLYRLHEQSALPAILFNYDRGNCESICQAVMEKLKEAEKKWKETSSIWAKKLTDWETWKKNRKEISKMKAGKKSGKLQEEGMSKADLEREKSAIALDTWESFDPDAPVDGFHFKDGAKLQQSELDEYAKELRWRGVQDWLIEALGRGIAVHHSGMNRKYRHIVELLFRKGYLRVVVATGTLALGINMPCKTVVFCGDSVFLTALNFRQAAGRAGRRGFDVLGNVVFHGIPVSKVCRLLSSRLPELTGHFPITTTLVLRLCTLLSESNNSAFALRSIDALLSQPRLYLGGEENRMTVLHHLRFSLEYLRRQFLLDQRGTPLNFAGCVSHLYYTENASFAFHALLKDGYFQRLCAGIRRNPESTERILRTLMLVLSHIFGRRYCRHVDREFVEAVVKTSPSSVILAPLPAAAAAILRAHNDDTLDVFKTYVRTYVAQHVRAPDDVLPLTGVRCGGDGSADRGAINAACTRPNVRSAFVALSGHADDAGITSIGELCRTVRAGVFLEEAVIPYMPVCDYPQPRPVASWRPQQAASGASGQGKDLPLNAYLLDFFKHGDASALVAANGIRRGDVWFVLNDFSMVLATIVASLEGFVAGNDDVIVDAMAGGGGEEMEEEKLWEGGAGSAPGKMEKKEPMPRRNSKAHRTGTLESWEEDAEADAQANADAAADADDEDSENWGGGGGAAGTAAGGDGSGKAGADEVLSAPAWEDDGDGSLLDVLAAFKKLSEEFNGKFKAMWA
ncbi:putative helicase [Lasiodiplodia theobromae]|uniref:Putative helicase n=1 Tax=Lasiodiplodia theobromae TaxID=45133 RepID=A0A5N5D4W1_9PEZI|nr:putative helicase [Lasiodiplodia theobromae]